MKKKKTVKVSRRIIGRDPTSQLYRAVIRFVESRKGSIVVIGGITTMIMPDDREFMFHVAVKCLGRKPEPIELPESESMERKPLTGPRRRS